MSPARLLLVTALAMFAFAGNSLLCRVALSETAIDAASFTSIRLLAGALTLALLVRVARPGGPVGGNWPSAFALFAYAAAFSFAYIRLTAATGALILFGAVQCTMIGYGLLQGERMNGAQTCGVLVAVAGLVGLLLPGLSAPPPAGAALMLAAGVAWGVYSLRGRGAGDATRETAGNFARAVPFTLLVSALWFANAGWDGPGVALAVASGAFASGVGYALWYSALPSLSATSAATVQLSVPALAAAGAAAFLGEPITLRLGLASLAILGGVALFILSGHDHRINRAPLIDTKERI
jgi:drug/metabolite transporter (DMT)-like permease